MSETEPTELKGIGGWLILPLIGLIFSPLYLLWLLVKSLPDFAARAPEHPLAMQIFAGVLTLPVFAFFIFCLVRFLQLRREVPWLMTALYGCIVVFWLASLIARFKGFGIPDDAGERATLLGYCVGASIIPASSVAWIFYFHKSVRVANTFTVVGPTRENAGEPTGIGGWLWLPVLFLGFWTVVSGVGLFGGDLVGELRYSIQHHHWPALAYDSVRLVLIVYSVVCLYALFRRWRATTWLMPAGFLCWAATLFWITAFKPISLQAAALFAVPVVAFAIYFLVSKRVKNTFVR